MNQRPSPVNFLTGGTGFLGSHIGAELLRRGQDTCFLIREQGESGAGERLKKLLDWHGVDRASRAKAHLVEGGLADINPGSGLLRGRKIDRVIHCASDTSFSERHRPRVWTTNVENLKVLLDFVVKARIPSFLHVSTAYAAGKRTGRCPEKPIQNHQFFNVYEESKAAAEEMLLDRCRENGISLTILRPSIIYGHSRTGRTLRFNALYYPVKTALFLRKVFLEDIRERGGHKAAEAGVSLDADGTTHFPLRIDVGTNGGLNLIPVDFFVEAFFAITQAAPAGGIYHIVNPHQSRIADIIAYAQDQFKFKGIRACSSGDFLKTPRNPLERLFERYLEAYSPYMKDRRLFANDKSAPILKARGLVCPAFDAVMSRRCMAYAVANNWTTI